MMNIQISSNYQGEQMPHNPVNWAPKQLLVIDPQVPDYQHLAAGIQPGVELLILDSNRDGIEQITQYLTSLPAGEQGSKGAGEQGSKGAREHRTLRQAQEGAREQLSPQPPSPPAPPLPSLHIISHGSPGTLYLGNSTLELNNLEKYRHQLEKWHIAHLYIYGCEVAAGDAGAEFLQKLSQITQAPIYANPHPTGNIKSGSIVGV